MSSPVIPLGHANDNRLSAQFIDIPAAFLRAYFEGVKGSRILPADRAQSTVLFDAFVMERALHHLRGLFEDGADGVRIPLMGIQDILAGG